MKVHRASGSVSESFSRGVRVFPVATLAVLCLFLAVQASADVAPNPSRAEPAMRMLSENVQIRIVDDTALVKAEFVLKNLGLEKLRYCRYSPGDVMEHCGDYYYQLQLAWPLLESQKQTISGLTVKFNGWPGTVWDEDHGTHKLEPPIPYWMGLTSQHILEETLDTVTVLVEYPEKLVFTDGVASFTYILRSGALWSGTIGKADIKLEFGDNYRVEEGALKPKKTEPGALSWTFTDFKPTKDIVVRVKQVKKQ